MKKLPVLVLVLIFAIAGSIYLTKKNNWEVSKNGTNSSFLAESAKPNWSKLVNSQAEFEIEYPNNLHFADNPAVVWKKVDGDVYSEGGKQGLTTLCVDAVVPEGSYCKNGLNIYYGLPFLEWGGGCPDHITTINMLDTAVEVCEPPTGLQTWEQINHPNGLSEVKFDANYSEQFTPELTREILQTFKFSK